MGFFNTYYYSWFCTSFWCKMANEACNENEEHLNLKIRKNVENKFSSHSIIELPMQNNSEYSETDINLHSAKCEAPEPIVSNYDTYNDYSVITIKSKTTNATWVRTTEKKTYKILENRIQDFEDCKCNSSIHKQCTIFLSISTCEKTLSDAYINKCFSILLGLSTVYSVCVLHTHRPSYFRCEPVQDDENTSVKSNRTSNKEKYHKAVNRQALMYHFQATQYLSSSKDQSPRLGVKGKRNDENTSIKSSRASHKEKYHKAVNRQALMYHFQANQYLSPSKGQSPRLGVKGKGKRWKKVSHTSEYLDVYHYLRPGIVDALVYPVHRQASTRGSNSNGNTGDKFKPQQLPPFKEQKLPDEVIGIPWEDFKLEIKRLATFSYLPVHLPVFAIRLAREGFVCLSDISIICFFCKFVYHGWKPGDRPEELHKQLQPDCPMVKGISCNNQPINPFPDQQVLELKQLWHLAGVPSGQQSTHYSTEQQSGQNETLGQMVYALPNYLSTPTSATRLPDVPVQLPADGRTTTAGQSDLDPDRQPRQGSRQQTLRDGETTTSSLPMATQGTPLLNSTLSQQLNETHTTVADTLAVDSATDLGSSTSRSQVIDGSAQPEVPSTNGELGNSGSRTGTAESQQVVTYSQLGIVTEPPKRPDMATLQSRISSFRNWPTNHSQNVKDLSEAGFYYAGYGDCGRCFFCGGGLKNWERTDSPLVEHARWFPRCAYVRQCRGQDFIDIVQDLNRTRQQISMADVLEEMRRRKAEGERLQDIVDPSIVSVLDLGYTQSQVDSALQQLLQQGSMVTVEKILDCLQGSGQFPDIGAEGGVESDTEVDNLEDLVSQNSEIRQQRICKICLDKEVSIVFLPCGHLVCCAECSPALRSCPMCRERIKGRVRAFPA